MGHYLGGICWYLDYVSARVQPYQHNCRMPGDKYNSEVICTAETVILIDYIERKDRYL